jgi:hypothetical protein
VQEVPQRSINGQGRETCEWGMLPMVHKQGHAEEVREREPPGSVATPCARGRGYGMKQEPGLEFSARDSQRVLRNCGKVRHRAAKTAQWSSKVRTVTQNSHSFAATQGTGRCVT